MWRPGLTRDGTARVGRAIHRSGGGVDLDGVADAEGRVGEVQHDRPEGTDERSSQETLRTEGESEARRIGESAVVLARRIALARCFRFDGPLSGQMRSQSSFWVDDFRKALLRRGLR